MVGNRKQPHLKERALRLSIIYRKLGLTFCNIPASARAVYAPRENPNMQILSPCASRRREEVLQIVMKFTGLESHSSASRTRIRL